MAMFVISKRDNGEYKFVFTSRKGKIIFTSIACRHKEDCDRIINAIRENTGLFVFRQSRMASGKYFFRMSKDGLVLATSRKFSTELSIQKGIADILKYAPSSETLDFSENALVFPDAADVFI